MASLFHDDDTLDCCLALKADASGVRPEVVVTVRRPGREEEADLLLGAERRTALYMAIVTGLESMTTRPQLNGRRGTSVDVDDRQSQGHRPVLLVHGH